mmetsp:Transcript_11884/g.33297  ORF Transcript_11884/g.33297 Transcript_11884/m.33297 type:complete len:236 (+) Transcript_11884:316-1023(+)
MQIGPRPGPCPARTSHVCCTQPCMSATHLDLTTFLDFPMRPFSIRIAIGAAERKYSRSSCLVRAPASSGWTRSHWGSRGSALPRYQAPGLMSTSYCNRSARLAMFESCCNVREISLMATSRLDGKPLAVSIRSCSCWTGSVIESAQHVRLVISCITLPPRPINALADELGITTFRVMMLSVSVLDCLAKNSICISKNRPTSSSVPLATNMRQSVLGKVSSARETVISQPVLCCIL